VSSAVLFAHLTHATLPTETLAQRSSCIFILQSTILMKTMTYIRSKPKLLAITQGVVRSVYHAYAVGIFPDDKSLYARVVEKIGKANTSSRGAGAVVNLFKIAAYRIVVDEGKKIARRRKWMSELAPQINEEGEATTDHLEFHAACANQGLADNLAEVKDLMEATGSALRPAWDKVDAAIALAIESYVLTGGKMEIDAEIAVSIGPEVKANTICVRRARIRQQMAGCFQGLGYHPKREISNDGRRRASSAPKSPRTIPAVPMTGAHEAVSDKQIHISNLTM